MTDHNKQEETKMSQWMTSKQAADYLTTSVSKIQRLCRYRKLAHNRMNGKLMFRREYLDEYVESTFVPPDISVVRNVANPVFNPVTSLRTMHEQKGA